MSVGNPAPESSGWIIAGVVAVVLLGLAAYSYRDTESDFSVEHARDDLGQGMRAPVPSTPPATRSPRRRSRSSGAVTRSSATVFAACGPSERRMPGRAVPTSRLCGWVPSM